MALLDKAIGRRNFLKGGAAAIAVAGLSGCVPDGTDASDPAVESAKAHAVESDAAIVNGGLLGQLRRPLHQSGVCERRRGSEAKDRRYEGRHR